MTMNQMDEIVSQCWVSLIVMTSVIFFTSDRVSYTAIYIDKQGEKVPGLFQDWNSGYIALSSVKSPRSVMQKSIEEKLTINQEL